MRTSGISPSFPGLSQSPRQVAHVLLTRSPLGLPRCCHRLGLARLACIRHAASVRPEPGSNSPSRPRTPRVTPTSLRSQRAGAKWLPRTDWRTRRTTKSSFLGIRNCLVNDHAELTPDAVARTGFLSLPLFRCQGTLDRTHDSRGVVGATAFPCAPGGNAPGCRGNGRP